MRRHLLYAINLAEMVEGAEDAWVVYVNRPGAYEVSQALCSRPGCLHPTDHHSRSKGRCFTDDCVCEAVSAPNRLSV